MPHVHISPALGLLNSPQPFVVIMIQDTIIFALELSLLKVKDILRDPADPVLFAINTAAPNNPDQLAQDTAGQLNGQIGNTLVKQIGVNTAIENLTQMMFVNE